MEKVTVSGLFKAETDNAILVIKEGEEHWFPKSKATYVGDVGEELDFEIPAWLARSHGLDW